MLEIKDEIELYKGGTSIVQVDMTAFKYAGGHVDLIIEDDSGKRVFVTQLTEQKLYSVCIPYTVTSAMEPSRKKYGYGLTHCVDGERFPLCLKSPVSVSRVVAGCLNENEQEG